MGIKQALLQMFFPEGIKCIICNGELDKSSPYGLCERCSFTYVTKRCEKCGRKLDSHDGNFCIDCMQRKSDVYYDIARASVVFENNAVKVVHTLKYGGGKYLAPYLARYIYDTYLENSLSCDMVTFVPMHEKRKKSRGYNQAELIALEFGKLSGIEVVKTINRVKDTPNLARMNRKQREETIKGAFEICAQVKDKTIVLIDDVFTSGNTASECARVLKKNKADKVVVLTFATSSEKAVLY